MDTAVAVLEWTQRFAFLLVASWAVVRWWHRRTRAGAWAAATFATLAGIVLIGLVTEQMEEGPAATALGLVSLAGLIGFPYLLLRFHDSFDSVANWFRRATGILGVVVFLLAIPLVGQDGQEGPPDALTLLVLALLAVYWVVPLGTVAVRFWRAGMDQPTMVRRRMRLLAIGSGALGLALLLVVVTSAAAGDEDPASGTALVVQLLSLGSAGFFLVGFAPPSPLRSYWRQAEERALHEASVGLMGATTPADVARLLVPHLQAVLSARAVALVHDGDVLSSVGLEREEASSMEVGDGSATTHPLTDGALHVWPNPYTPFFDDEDFDVLGRLAVLTDLALARTGLLAAEQEARQELEAANAELESFVYSASHDLKSPLIAIQSYLDVFDEQVAGDLDEETTWYLTRMRTNAEYMSDLVGDLLELSRVGRVDTAPAPVDLGQLVAEVAIEVNERFAASHVEVGELPTLWMNPLRCRQLFRNLIENAAAHAEDGEVTVWVEARTADEDDGVVVLVRDDGEGIPVDYRERIFGVFERLHAGGATTGSTGIGLAICRKIVEAVDGHIWVTDHEGGAEFAIRFPRGAMAHRARDEQSEVHA